MTSIPFNFLGLSDELADHGRAKAVILPVPYELTTSYVAGTRNGPMAIIAASRQVETFDADLGFDSSQVGIATLDELEPVVGSPEIMQEVIYNACREQLAEGKFVLALGGEHSIAVALVRAHRDIYPNLSVLQIDAHTDLRDSYQGSRFSHACVMARIAEMVPFVAVGVRSFSGNDNEQRYGDNLIRPRRLRTEPKILEKIVATLTENVYITIDLDGFDPAVVPAVGTPEPGGLTWDEVISILHAVSRQKKIVGADLVELSPQPSLVYADFTAAKLAYKVISFSFYRGC